MFIEQGCCHRPSGIVRVHGLHRVQPSNRNENVNINKTPPSATTCCLRIPVSSWSLGHRLFCRHSDRHHGRRDHIGRCRHDGLQETKKCIRYESNQQQHIIITIIIMIRIMIIINNILKDKRTTIRTTFTRRTTSWRFQCGRHDLLWQVQVLAQVLNAERRQIVVVMAPVERFAHQFARFERTHQVDDVHVGDVCGRVRCVGHVLVRHQHTLYNHHHHHTRNNSLLVH